MIKIKKQELKINIMIDIKGITKSFGSLQVLKGIDLHIKKGEIGYQDRLVPERLRYCRL